MFFEHTFNTHSVVFQSYKNFLIKKLFNIAVSSSLLEKRLISYLLTIWDLALSNNHAFKSFKKL